MPSYANRLVTRRPVFLCALLAVAGIAESSPTADRIGDNPTGRALFRLELHNDIIGDHDGSGITGAWSVQKHAPVAADWNDLKGVPDFMRHWGARIPTLTDEGLYHGASVSLGQTVQTPSDLKRTELADWDVPYAGVLAARFSWYAFDDDDFRGFQLTAGIVGPPALGKPAQDLIHEIVGSDKARGWDNQLSTEPLINLFYQRKRKLWRLGNPAGLSFDLAASGHLGIGNLLTHAGVGLEARVGSNMPGGFLYAPDPGGLAMRHNARLAPPSRSKPSIYASLSLTANLVAHDLLLDGNTFADSHSIDRENHVGHAIGGLHYETADWAARFSIALPSNYVIYGRAPPTEDAPEGNSIDGNAMLAALTFEYRY